MSDQAVAIHDVSVEAQRFLPVMKLAQAVERRNTIIQAVSQLMKDGQDFGTIPGTPKPTLYQPGADKLNNLFGLVPRFEILEKIEDWTGDHHGGEPFFSYTVQCSLWRGEYLMGEGIGSCNSWETKYRYRKAERVCPNCGQPAIIKGKAEYGGGFICFAKKGGCGAKFKDDDAAITGQVVGRVVNPDVPDAVNTVLKMGAKRAKIAATLNATSAHEFFTQDLEDMPQFGEPEPPRQAAPPPPAEPEHKPTPTTLDEVLATFTSKKSIAAAYDQLHTHFIKALDENIWTSILAENEYSKSVGSAKKAFTAAWKALEKEMAMAGTGDEQPQAATQPEGT